MRTCALLLSTLILGLALVSSAALGIDIHLRSGVGLAIGQQDSSVTMLLGPGDAAFSSPFTHADFQAARIGPHPVRPTPANGWIGGLSSDPSVRWLCDRTDNLGGSDLFAVDFEVPDTFEVAGLTLYYAVDNFFGTSTVAGIYVNEQPLPGSYRIGTLNSQNTFTADLTALLHTGTNTLYLYIYDFGYASGVIYNAIVSVTAPSSTGDEEPPSGALSLRIVLPDFGSPSASLGLERGQPVWLAVFDCGGRRIDQVYSGEHLGSGSHLVPIRSSGWGSGVYFIRAWTAEGAAAQGRLVLVR